MNYKELKDKLKKIKIIDILVNNAGTNIPEPFEKIKQSSMNYLIDLNLKAAFNVAQLVVKKMLKNKKRQLNSWIERPSLQKKHVDQNINLMV